MPFKVQSLLCLILLSGGLNSIQGKEFPQCANAEIDSFVMAIDDCASYIYCNGVDSFRDSCPESTYFDDRTQECAFDDAGICLRDFVSVLTEEQPEEDEEVAGNSTPAPTPPSQVTSTFPPGASTPSADSSPSTPAPSPSSSAPSPSPPAPSPSPPAPSPSSPALERPHCDTSGDGDYPHPQRCEYFYRCLSGYLTIVRCPYKYGWDFPTKQCKPITEAQCF